MPDRFNILDRANQAAFPIMGIRQRSNDRLFPQLGGTSTTAGAGNNTLRLSPIVLPNAITLSHLGFDIAVAGEAGSGVRLGIYQDTGLWYPGDLLAEAAALIDGTSATIQEVACPVTLQGGTLYWIGGAVQNAPTTQPQVRVLSNAPIAGPVTTGVPTAAGQQHGYQQTGVSGALPATFTPSVTPSGVSLRLHFRLA